MGFNSGFKGLTPKPTIVSFNTFIIAFIKYHQSLKLSSQKNLPTPHEMNQQFCPSSRHDYSPDKHRVFWVTLALRNNFFVPRSIAVIII
jgi:hypothetical protein